MGRWWSSWWGRERNWLANDMGLAIAVVVAAAAAVAAAVAGGVVVVVVVVVVAGGRRGVLDMFVMVQRKWRLGGHQQECSDLYRIERQDKVGCW